MNTTILCSHNLIQTSYVQCWSEYLQSLHDLCWLNSKSSRWKSHFRLVKWFNGAFCYHIIIYASIILWARTFAAGTPMLYTSDPMVPSAITIQYISNNLLAQNHTTSSNKSPYHSEIPGCNKFWPFQPGWSSEKRKTWSSHGFSPPSPRLPRPGLIDVARIAVSRCQGAARVALGLRRGQSITNQWWYLYG